MFIDLYTLFILYFKETKLPALHGIVEQSVHAQRPAVLSIVFVCVRAFVNLMSADRISAFVHFCAEHRTACGYKFNRILWGNDSEFSLE